MRRLPEDLLPLPTLAFEILLTLAEGDRHGYHIMQEVGARSGDGAPLHPGTLYRALARLLEQDLIDEPPAPRARSRGGPRTADDRRRPFRLTPFGRKVAEAEAARLDKQVRRARRQRLLGSSRRA